MSQTHEQPTTTHQEEHESEASTEIMTELGAAATKEVVSTDGLDELLGDIDAALEEELADIDDILEENAEEFMAAYIQKGGQ